MSKLSKEELLETLEIMFTRACADLFQHEPSQYTEPMEKKIRRTCQQITEMIQKPEVTKEWIEGKARKAHDISLAKFSTTCGYDCSAMVKYRGFIRSLVEEIPLQQLDKNGK